MVVKQKLVILHPGKYTEPRKLRLKEAGRPNFTITTISKSFGSQHEIKMPSDVHMFWEIFQDKDIQKVNELRFVVVGNNKVPDLSEYSQSVNTIVFSGHIGNTRTALEIVNQLNCVTTVRFFLGGAEQLPFLLPRQEQKIFPVKSVKNLHVNMQIDKNPSSDFKQIVNTQWKNLLSDCIDAFPEVEMIETDLPPEGRYFDQLKNALPKFPKLNTKTRIFIPEIKDNKLIVVCKPQVAKPKPAAKIPEPIKNPQKNYKIPKVNNPNRRDSCSSRSSTSSSTESESNTPQIQPQNHQKEKTFPADRNKRRSENNDYQQQPQNKIPKNLDKNGHQNYPPIYPQNPFHDSPSDKTAPDLKQEAVSPKNCWEDCESSLNNIPYRRFQAGNCYNNDRNFHQSQHNYHEKNYVDQRINPWVDPVVHASSNPWSEVITTHGERGNKNLEIETEDHNIEREDQCRAKTVDIYQFQNSYTRRPKNNQPEPQCNQIQVSSEVVEKLVKNGTISIDKLFENTQA